MIKARSKCPIGLCGSSVKFSAIYLKNVEVLNEVKVWGYIMRSD